jgi:hypothetical protein
MGIGVKYAVIVPLVAAGYVLVATKLSSSGGFVAAGALPSLAALQGAGTGYNPPDNEVESSSGGETKSSYESGKGEETKTRESPSGDGAKGNEEGALDAEKFNEDVTDEVDSEANGYCEGCSEQNGSPSGKEEEDVWNGAQEY